MKNEALYNKTVDILVQAYFNDTLAHEDCHACAVGNIIAANCNYQIEIYQYDSMWIDENGDRIEQYWTGVFFTKRHKKFYGMLPDKVVQTIEFDNYKGASKKQIQSTGYSAKELAKIEYAFEAAPKGKTDDEWMFNGLMAVIEVLDQIHGNTDAAVTTQSKERFVKHSA